MPASTNNSTAQEWGGRALTRNRRPAVRLHQRQEGWHVGEWVVFKDGGGK
jgi:hypothetical protein